MRAPWLIYVSGLLMFLYVLYAVWGAFAKTVGVPLPVRLGDLGEFLLFFASIATFAIHVLSRRQKSGSEDRNGTRP